MTATRVFDGAHIRATLFNPGAARLFVSLRQRIENDGAFDEARPVRSFTDHGFAHLHLQTRLNDWFINPDTRPLEIVMAGLSRRYEGARGIGFSMGGYGLLRFARALRLQHVVLVSPQVSIHPEVVPWDRRYRRHADGFDRDLADLGRHGSGEVAGALLYDPFRPLDRKNADMICAVHPHIRPVPLAGGGHPATRVIRSAGRFGALQEMLREGGTDRVALRALHRAARRGSTVYWRHLAARAEAGSHPSIERAARAHLAALEAENPVLGA